MVFDVHLFARFRNDYYLGPFFSDGDGLVVMTKEALEKSVEDHLDWAGMDYDYVENCLPFVEMKLLPEENINFIIKRLEEGRIMKGELELWRSIEELLLKLKNSPNKDIKTPREKAHCIRDEWDGSKREFKYTYIIDMSSL